MGNKQGRLIKADGGIDINKLVVRTQATQGVLADGEVLAAKVTDATIDYDHFAPDPMMVDIAEELAMVSEKVNIEDFKILKLLGKGNYGKVMLVQHKEEGTLFALKTLRKNKVIKTSQIEHTKSERRYNDKLSLHRLLERMEHPFIVSLRYAFQTKAKLYMVFDYICGGDLFLHLKNAELFTEERARFYAAEILLAFEFLHKKHIIYRDLKPENVLIDLEGHVKLTDFGLSKELVGGKTNTFCGTDEYLAPEIILNESYNESVDWWALGILLFEMLTGWAPFEDNNRKGLFEKIVKHPVDLSHENISESAGDLIKKMLAKRVCDRIKPEDIKKHKFFASIDFSNLYMRKVKPPFKPELVKSGCIFYRNQQLTYQTSTQILRKKTL